VVIAEYTYDALNRRIRKTVTNSDELNGTTVYIWDGWQAVEEHGPRGTKTYTYGNYIDEPITMTTADGTFYYHTNNLYNVAALTDGAGAVVERYRYSAYGEPCAVKRRPKNYQRLTAPRHQFQESPHRNHYMAA
jgi:hypothetical protein